MDVKLYAVGFDMFVYVLSSYCRAPISLTHYPLTTSLSDPPSPLQPGSSHPVLCSEVSSPGGSSPNLIRVHLPHAQRTVVRTC